jgi:hypothetical protein
VKHYDGGKDKLADANAQGAPEERVTMAWRSTNWARCLGWIQVLAFVSLASALLFENLPIDPFPWGFLPPLVADFLIGVRVRERWWVYGPMVAIAALSVAAIVWIAVAAATYEGPSTQGPGVALGFFVPGVVVVATGGSILHGLCAAAGVWWGQRREAATL